MVFFGEIPRSGIAGSYGSSIFKILKTLHTVFHSSCINLTSPRTVHKGPLLSTSSPVLVICCRFDNSHSDSCEVIFHCGLVYISLMISDVEHLFMCLLAICMFSLKKCLFSPLPILKSDYYYYCYWFVWIPYTVWILTPYLIDGLQIFSPIP